MSKHWSSDAGVSVLIDSSMPSLSVCHRVSMPAPTTHLVHVETTVFDGSAPLPDPLVLFMAVWTPGSYLVREYARHVEGLVAAPPARATKIRKNAWRIDPGSAERAVVSYRVYAGELTVRTSHLDDSHAFLVPAALFLAIEGREYVGARVEIVAPAGWHAASPLRRFSGDDDGIVRLDAPDFETLVDSPIELGTHREEQFEALGKTHRWAICPAQAVESADVKRMVEDTKTIVLTEANLFGGQLPYDAYDLIVHFASRGRGGLEHGASAALIAPAHSFATRGGYLDLLSLIAHEIFHAWNVKRIRPAGLTPYGYQQECYTRLLWWFEGATSYYDWRVLVLSSLCTVDEYLDHLAAEVAYLDQTHGRFVQSLEEASFDAWIKLYRPDENSTNATVSYYRKGEIVAALIDIELRVRSNRSASLDQIVKYLWDEYGSQRRSVPEDGMHSVFEQVSKTSIADLYEAWIRTPGEIDYDRTLARVGLSVERLARHDAPPCSLGLRLRLDAGRTMVASATRASSAELGGIHAGDELVAIAGARVEGVNIDAFLQGRTPGERIDVAVVRDGRLLRRTVELAPPRLDRVKIVAQRDPAPGACEAFAAWLGQPHPSTRSKASS
jgi:predicted metalloprotease with PDZ domain